MVYSPTVVPVAVSLPSVFSATLTFAGASLSQPVMLCASPVYTLLALVPVMVTVSLSVFGVIVSLPSTTTTSISL